MASESTDVTWHDLGLVYSMNIAWSGCHEMTVRYIGLVPAMETEIQETKQIFGTRPDVALTLGQLSLPSLRGK